MIIRFEGVSEEGLKTIREFIASPENVLHPSAIAQKRLARKPYLYMRYEGIVLAKKMLFARELRSRKGPEITLELREDFRPEGCKEFIHSYDTPRVYLRRMLRAIGSYRIAIVKCHVSDLWWKYSISKLNDGPTIWHHDLKGPFSSFDYTSGGWFFAHVLRLTFRRHRGCDCVVETHGAVREGWLAESDYDGGDWHAVPHRYMYTLMTILNKFMPQSNVE